MVIEAATDNKNRTAADLRLILSKNHGSFAASGSVLYPFHQKGRITVPCSLADEDRILERTLDAGAEEIFAEDRHHVVATPPDRFYPVADALMMGGVTSDSQKHEYPPDNAASVADETIAAQVFKLHEAPEDCGDTQNAYANFEVSEGILARPHA